MRVIQPIRGRLRRVSGPALVALVVMLPFGSAAAPGVPASASCPVASEPQVAVDTAGDAFALWRCTASSGSNFVQAAQRPAASRTWSAPQNLQGPGSDPQRPWISRLALALNGRGDAVAIWARYGGLLGDEDVVQAAVRSAASDTWSASQDLFVTSNGGQAGYPRVALDAAGDAVAAWLTDINGPECPACSGIVRAAMRPAGGTWSAPQQLSASGPYAASPQVALDPAGDAVAIWVVGSGSGSGVQAAVRLLGAGDWSAPQTLSARGTVAEEPQVAFDAAGNALAIWPAFVGGNSTVETAARAATTGTWSAPREIPGASSREVLQLALAVNAAGDAAAVWRRGSEDWPPAVVQASLHSAAAGMWSAPQTLTAADGHGGEPKVAVDAAGDVVAIWQEPVYTSPFICPTEHCTFPRPIVQATVRPAATGTWGAVRSWHAGEPQVAVDPAGDAVAVWVANDRHEIVQTAVRPAASGMWSAPQYVSASAPPCLVPWLIGKTLAKAKAVLDSKDCRTGIVSRAYSRKVRKGRVLAQRPKAGTRLKHGGKVALVMSRGRKRR